MQNRCILTCHLFRPILDRLSGDQGPSIIPYVDVEKWGVATGHRSPAAVEAQHGKRDYLPVCVKGDCALLRARMRPAGHKQITAASQIAAIIGRSAQNILHLDAKTAAI